jgi:hypothetical protein
MGHPARVLLFQKRFHQGLVDGSVTLTFRRWEKPHVKPGGRYRCHPIGVLVVDRLDRVRLSDITQRDAQRTGFASRDELVDYIRSGPGGPASDDTELYRVELHHGGEEDRVDIALDDRLSSEDVEAIAARLARMDAKGEWTATTLRLIQANPRVAASKLASKLGRETLPFKVDVRKLKRLGLTQSFEVGYDVSPRGRAFLEAVRARKKTRRAR